MGKIHSFQLWLDRIPASMMTLIRVTFGVFILIQGLVYAKDIQGLASSIDPEDYQGNLLFMAHYVVFIMIGGGILITLGFLTRTSVLLQLPIFTGALLLSASHIMQFDVLMILLAVFVSLVFLIYGSGKQSVDEILSSVKIKSFD